MREEIGSEHGLDDGIGVAGVAGLGGEGGEEAEGVGIEAVELVGMAEAGDNRLGAGEGFRGVLVGELRDKAAKAGGAREAGGGGGGSGGVNLPGFFSLPLPEKGDQGLVLGVVVGGGEIE